MLLCCLFKGASVLRVTWLEHARIHRGPPQLVAAGFACSLHCILPWLGIKLDYFLLPTSAVIKLGRIIITVSTILVILLIL